MAGLARASTKLRVTWRGHRYVGMCWLVAAACLLVIDVPTHMAAGAEIPPGDAGATCWENGRGDPGQVAQCLHVELRVAAEASPARAAAASTRALMIHVARTAAALSSAGMQQAALDLCDAALEVDPVNPNLLFLRGNALGTLGRTRAAAASFMAAVIALPLHADALHNFAAVTMDDVEQAPAEHALALRALQTALRLVPDSARLRLSCGIAMAQLSPTLAANHLGRSLALDPSSELAARELARTLDMVGRDAAAEDALPGHVAGAMDSDSTQAALWRELGDLYLRRGEAQRAREAFDKVLRLAPQDARAHSGRGAALRELGLFEMAVVAYESAAASSRSPETLTNLGSVLVETGRFESALQARLLCLRVPRVYQRVCVHVCIRECVSGVCTQRHSCMHTQALQSALALAPAFAPACTSSGFALAELGRTSEAEQLFRQAVAADALHATAWNNLGHFLRTQHR